jgi:hypothetical protein
VVYYPKHQVVFSIIIEAYPQSYLKEQPFRIYLLFWKILEQYDKQRRRYVNQAIQREKQARNDKLEKIAKTLPNATSNENQGTRTPYSTTQTSSRSLRIVTQTTPRSGITRGQNQPPISTAVPKLGTSIINKPSLLISNKKTDPDETSSEVMKKSY